MGEPTQTHGKETHWQTEMMGGHGLDVVCEMGIALRNSVPWGRTKYRE